MSSPRDNDNYDSHYNKTENENTTILDLRVSCDIFWKYQMNYKVDRSNYLDEDNNNINENGCHSETKTAVFSRLERHLCDAMIAHIHEDLLLNGEEEKIQKLCEVSSKFHIHGHTTHSLLYQKSNTPHADHGGIIYICSHC